MSSQLLGHQYMIERFYLLSREWDGRASEVLRRRQKAAWFCFTLLPVAFLLKWHGPIEGNKGAFEILPCAGSCDAEIQKSFHSHLSASEGSLSLCWKPLWSSHSLGLLSAGTSQEEKNPPLFISCQWGVLVQKNALFPCFFICLLIGQCQALTRSW